MKTLLLMRHGKSSWKDETLADFDRPLKKRGRKDLPKMAELMREEGLIPDYVLSSSALRCRQTMDILLEELKLDADITQYSDRLYKSELEDHLAVVATLSDDYNKVLIIGHNPTLEAFLQTLTGKIEALPTSAIACIKVGIQSWKDLEEDDEVGQLCDIWRPKEL